MYYLSFGWRKILHGDQLNYVEGLSACCFPSRYPISSHISQTMMHMKKFGWMSKIGEWEWDGGVEVVRHGGVDGGDIYGGGKCGSCAAGCIDGSLWMDNCEI